MIAALQGRVPPSPVFSFLRKGSVPIKNIRNMVLSSLFASLLAICAWLSVPLPGISFTMQTFGVLLTLGILGGKWGSISILLYLLMGLVGLPVFSGFRGGGAALLDPAGGFLWGFLVCGLLYRAAERAGRLPAMLFGMLGCYLCGCFWFSRYAGISMAAAAGVCVLPWVIPDGIKLALAWELARRISRQLKRNA